MTFKNHIYLLIPAFVVLFCMQAHTKNKTTADLKMIKQLIPAHLDSALVLSKELTGYSSDKSDSLVAISHYFQGLIYYYKGQYYISSEHYKKALNSKYASDNFKFRGKCLNNLGVNYDMTDQYDLALTEYMKSMKIDQHLNDQEGVAQSKVNIGLLYYNLKQFDLSETYFNEALKYFSETDNHIGIGLCYHNFGLIYLDNKEYNKSLDFLLKAHSEYFISNAPYERGVNLHNLIICASRMGYFDDALHFLEESKNLAEQNSFNHLKKLNALGEAELCIEKGDFKKAKDILDQFTPDNINTQLRKSKLDLQINIAINTGTNTSEIIKNYIEIRDSLERYQTNQLINDLQNQYGTEIDFLSLKLDEEKTKSRNRIIISTAIIGILSIIIFIFTLASRRKREAEKSPND